MKIIKTQDLTPASMALMSQTELLHIYNGLDCCVTAEVFHEIEGQLDNQTRATYEFSKALQGPCLEMKLRGILVDQSQRLKTIAAYEKDLNILKENLERIFTEGIGRSFNWNSPAQMKELFYGILGLPPIKKRNSKGQYTPTVDRNALEALDSYFIAQPIVSHLLGLRDIAKKIGVLKTDIDPDGRMRSSFNIGGTSTGRLSSSLSDFGTGCVLPTAEVLTRIGWMEIQKIVDYVEIAQWDNGVISFVPCTVHKDVCETSMLQFKTEQSQLTVTRNHRVLFCDYYNKSYRVESAQSVCVKHQAQIPIAGMTIGEDLSYPAFLAMLMADFSKTQWGWAGQFKKQRKIDRFFELAKEFGFEFNEHHCSREGYRRFFVNGFTDWPKEWGEWILKLTPESADALIEESRYWDSHDRGSGFILYTASKTQAEWYATLAHLTNRGTTVRKMEQGLGSYSDTTMWCINVKSRDYAQLVRKHWHVYNYQGPVYCPQVPSSFWLVRENGFISVTGNTNLQNLEERLRRPFVADVGYKFAYVDLEQAESRLVGAIEWNLFHDGRYLDACESGDLHTTVCRLAWTTLPWTDSIADNKRVAEQPFYRQHSYRHMAKVLGHGTNYNGKPYTMAKHTKLDAKLIADFQSKYFTAFPAHQRWHAAVASRLLTDGNLTTLTGRRRWFFGRRNDDATIREAIAYDPQGSVADILNRGMLNLWRANICQILIQIHDALLIQYPAHLENTIVPQVLELIKVPIELNHGRTLLIPAEAQTGFNWSKFDKDTNPDGLRKWTGADGRVRQEQPETSKLAGLLSGI